MKRSSCDFCHRFKRVLTQGLGQVVLTIVFLFAFIRVVPAQINLTGTSYTQDFNSISNGLPTGWSVRTNASASSLGTSANFPTANKTWTDTTGEFGNCASTVSNVGTNFTGTESTTIQGNCTNRALAIRQTGSFGDPGAAFVLQIANSSGFSNFTFSVDLDQLHTNGYSTTWTIDYAVGNSPSTFTTLGTFPDPNAFGATRQTFGLGADANNQGNNIWIRVVALTSAVGSGSRDTFGIDNFALNYNNPTPLHVPLNIQQVGANVVLSWNNSLLKLQSAPLVTGTYTNIPGATNPYTNAITSGQKFFLLTYP